MLNRDKTEAIVIAAINTRAHDTVDDVVDVCGCIVTPAPYVRDIGVWAAATRYVVIEPSSSYECNRTITPGRDPRTRRHTLLVTRTRANEYTLYTYRPKLRGVYSDRFHNKNIIFLHAQTLASAILFESIISILATSSIAGSGFRGFILILQERHFHVKRYEHVSKQDRYIDIRTHS